MIDIRNTQGNSKITAFDQTIPIHELENNIHKISRDKKVILFCNHGIQSKMALQILINNHGFKNAYHLKGGIVAWNEFLFSTSSKKP